MKLLVMLILALPLFARNAPLAWSQAVVESGLRQEHFGDVYHEPPVHFKRSVTPVRESIYIDAGEWLYHVSHDTTRRMANLQEGDRIEVAVNGKRLFLRVGGKRYTTRIMQKSRSDGAVSPPASPR